MNDEETSEDQANEAGSKEPPQTDPFLQQLVYMANSSFLNYGITLNVKGTIITGRLVSVVDYFEHFGDQAQEFTRFNLASGEDDTNVRKALGDVFRKWGEKAKEAMEAEGDKPSRPEFIHLQDAKVVVPGQPMMLANESVWWRGRIAEVDGFIFGSLSESDAAH